MADDAVDISGMPDPTPDLAGSATDQSATPPASAAPDISGMPAPEDLFKQHNGRAPKSPAELQTFLGGSQDLKMGSADPIVGLGELGLNAVSGIAAQAGGFLAHVGTLLATQDPDAAKSVRDAVQSALTYQPKFSTTGPAMQEATSKILSAAWQAAKGPQAKAAVDNAMRAHFGDSATDAVEAGAGMAGEAAMALGTAGAAGGAVRGAAERAVGDIGVTPHGAPTGTDIRGATQPNMRPAAVAALPSRATPPIQEPEARPVTGADLKKQPDPLAATKTPPAANGRPPLVQGGTDSADAMDAAQARQDMDAAAANPTGARPPLQPGVDHGAAATDAQVQSDMGPATAAPPAAPPAAPAAKPAAVEKFVPPQAEGRAAGGETPEGRTEALQDLHELSGGALPEVRQSALTGNYDETGTDFQHSKMQDAGGKRMQAVIAGENNALKEGAKSIVEGTGGVAQGVDQGALTERGSIIDKAIGGIQDKFDSGIKDLYETAKQRAQGVPVPEFSRTKALLGDPTEFVGTAEGEALHRGAIARAQRLGLLDQNGAWRPATVEQAEQFRQWLGDQWTPRTARMISKTRDALDADVAAHGGQDLFTKARALRAQKATMLEEQPGVAALMKPDDRLGINRQVPLADIPDHIANLDRDQFNHVINVLKSSAHMGDDELAEQAAAALNEIKGHMAAKLEHAGGKAQDGNWNANDFYKQADKYSQKLPAVFNEEERRRIQVVNRAGNVLRMDKRYPGAAAQLHNTGIGAQLREGAGKAARGGVAVVAHHAMPLVGPMVEEATGIGAKVEKLIGGDPEKRRLAEVEKRIAKVPEREEQTLGQTIGGSKQRGGPEFNPYDNNPSRMRPLKPGQNDPRNTAKPNADVWGAERTKQERGGPLGGRIFGGKQRGAIGIENNASGESSASLEAQSRARQEKANGQHRYQIDSDGNVTPLRGVDSVDARAPQGHIIVQRGVGSQPYSVLDRGGLPATQANGLLARSQGLGKLAEAEREGQRTLGQRIGGGKQRGGPKAEPAGERPAPLKDDEPLHGMPTEAKIGKFNYHFGPNPTARHAAKDYAKESGVSYEPVTHFRNLPAAKGEKIAAAYDAMKDDPTDPKVKASYKALADETRAQFDAIQKTGLKVEFIKPGMDDPYAASPRLGNIDVKNNNHLWTFPTDSGFGVLNEAQKMHPLLQDSGRVIDGKKLTNNDLFRVVHDYFGHIAEGNGFRPNGEYNAWRLHSRLYSEKAQGALASETLGQNAWVNFGPHAAENKGASGAKTIYADQKAGLMPPEIYGGKKGSLAPEHDTAAAEGSEMSMSASAKRMYDKLDEPHQKAVDLITAQMHQNGGQAGKGVFEHLRSKNDWTPEQTDAVEHTAKAKYWGDLEDANKAAATPPEHPAVANLTPEERVQLRGHTATRLIDAFDKLPDTAEYAAAAVAGQAKKGWYADSAKAIANVFGPDAPRFSALLAAMSPQVSVQSNFHNALRTFINWDKAGRPTDPKVIKKIMSDSSQRGAANPKGQGNVLNAWVPNSVRALTSDAPESVKMSGPKVHSFYANLNDKVHEVTNDAWMATFAKIDPVKLGGKLNNSGPGKSAMYLAMSAKVRAAASMLSKMTGETWTPREVQETVWSWAKTAFEHANKQGDTTIPELVKHGHITDELIRSTPDFHQLFADHEHKGFLGNSRFSANAGGVSGAQSNGAQQTSASKAHATLSSDIKGRVQEHLKSHLQAAARRLENTRQGRKVTEDDEDVPF